MSLAASAAGDAPLPFEPLRRSPGLPGRRSGAGTGSLGIRGLLGRGRHRGPRGVEVLPDPAGELAGVSGADWVQLRGDAEARADLDLAVIARAGLETVQRPHGRSADHLAVEVIDAPVARADEVAGCLDEADRAAQVRAAGGDGDKAVLALALVVAAAPADVGGRLAGLADAGYGRQHDWRVRVLVELLDRADLLPGIPLLLEQRGDDESDGRQQNDGPGGPAERGGAR